jgi:hypothetical protein
MSGAFLTASCFRWWAVVLVGLVEVVPLAGEDAAGDAAGDDVAAGALAVGCGGGFAASAATDQTANAAINGIWKYLRIAAP